MSSSINSSSSSFSSDSYNSKISIQINLLIEKKLIICALGNLHYKISREKFEPERRTRNPEVRGSNPDSGSNVSLEIL